MMAVQRLKMGVPGWYGPSSISSGRTMMACTTISYISKAKPMAAVARISQCVRVSGAERALRVASLFSRMMESMGESPSRILKRSQPPVLHAASVIYEVTGRRLDPVRRQLELGGKPVAQFPRFFDALLLLVERRGELLD